MNTKQNKSGVVKYVAVYFVILGLAGGQFIFALQTGPVLPFMLMLALAQATLALLFFMNLARERTTLILALIPATLFVLFMMNTIWTDSFRLMLMRPFSK
jgi:cytochrome c oxidase subunit IV